MKENREEPFASEIIGLLKKEMKFKDWLIVILIGVILIQGLYHNWRWSQFETIVVDAESGYANYVTGENAGGIYNGANSSPPKEEQQG